MTRIAAVAPVVPPHRYPQAQITDAFARLVLAPGAPRAVLDRVHAATQVQTRHLSMPLERYGEITGFAQFNDVFIASAVELGGRAVGEALAAAGLHPLDVDVVLSTSVTGIAAPSIDARLMPILGLREDVKRIPVFGLGCVAGAAGVARLHDYLLGHPDEVAVLLSVEMCSLTVQRDDASMPNLVSCGLFGDGAAAVVLVGERRAGTMGIDGRGARPGAPQVVASRSRFYPDTERVMGWDIGGSGFRIVLAASVADVVEAHLADDVRGFLEGFELKVADIDRWVAHPGGPRVLEAMQRSLDLPEGALDVTWRSLSAVGNLSSASVLHVLAETMKGPRPEPGTAGVLMALGPGFCAELVLLRW